ncbi:MAG: hypothetical protein C5B59_08110 [Bacteroidetes bacterium]|nr:MAG: hypothetical protein C5B59_08110 [Bacteroidota bacterium]
MNNTMMEQDQFRKRQRIRVISFIIAGFLAIATFMLGLPQYNVYESRKAGEAALAHAQSAKEVAVAEAKAKMEAAYLLAQADTIRARGIANSNRIIGESLKNNPAYLQWLWIDQLKETKNQIIYVPSGLTPPIQEAQRFSLHSIPQDNEP